MKIKDNILIQVDKEDIKNGTFIIPDDITYIDSFAFSECTSLENIVIPSKVKTIGKFAFADCVSLKNINLLCNINTIEGYTFCHCKSLKKLVVPNSIIEIKDCAFAHNDLLEEINIPNNIKSISKIALYGCNNLKVIENIKSYKIFSMLAISYKIIAITSYIRNYYKKLIKYSEEDIILFRQYIDDNKEEIINYIFCELEDTELIYIVLFKAKLLTYEQTNELINKCKNPEIMAMLLEYSHHFNVDPFDKLDLDDDKPKTKKIDK